MSYTRIEGKVTTCILNNAANEVAPQFKDLQWKERKGRVAPQTTANNVLPVGWFQGHRWVEWTLTLLGEADSVLYHSTGGILVSATGPNLVMTAISATVLNHLNQNMYLQLLSPVIDTVDSNVKDFEPTITTINGFAYAIVGPST